MNTFKKILTAAAVCVSFVVSALAGAEVSSVSTQTHYPWNGTVDVTYVVTGVEAGSTYAVEAKITAGAVSETKIISNAITEDGKYTFTWDAAAAGFVGRDDAATVTVKVLESSYAVIDLSAGPNATSYPVAYAVSIDDPQAEEYKTTKLLLKNTGSTYVGVYEVTQKQYELVTGMTPSYFNVKDAAVRPVERVSFEAISENGGFFDLLTSKCGGLQLALPTVEEWEAAARGKMPADKTYNLGANNYKVLTGKTSDNGWLPLMGRYIDIWENGTKKAFGNNNPNQSSTPARGTATVGSYAANDNGLYDMHGNVAEWTKTPAADGKFDYVLCGGSWQDSAEECSISARWNYKESDKNQIYKAGLRVFGQGESFVQPSEKTATYTMDVAANNTRALKVTDDAGVYTFKYQVAGYGAGLIDWVEFDEGDTTWRPTAAGENVATNAATGETATFVVAALTMEDVVSTGYTGVYDGEAHTGSVTVGVPTANCEIKYGAAADACTDSAPATRTDAGTTTVYWQITSPFYTTVTGSFAITIDPLSIKGATEITLGDTLTYNGTTQQKAIVGVKVTDANGKVFTLESPADYTVLTDTDKGVAAATYTLWIEGTGNFKDQAKKEWKIEKFVIGQDAPTQGTGENAATLDIIFDNNYRENGLTYNGAEQKVGVNSISVTIDGSVQSFDSTHFEIVPGTNKGTDATAKVGQPYVIEVRGKGNFQGIARKEWTIGQLDIAPATVHFDVALTYNGDEQQIPVAKITIPGANEELTVPAADYAGGIAGDKGTDASVKNGQPYVLTATITDATSNFKGTATGDWGIAQKPLSVTMFTPVEPTYVFDRTAKEPTVTATDLSPLGVEAIAATDYEITSYIDNTEVTDPCTAAIVISATATGNYTGTVNVPFEITTAIINSLTLAEPTRFTYDGTEKEVAVSQMTVTTANGLTADNGNEYMINDASNKATEVGWYTITVTGLAPNFQGSATADFSIVPSKPKVTRDAVAADEGEVIVADPNASVSIELTDNSNAKLYFRIHKVGEEFAEDGSDWEEYVPNKVNDGDKGRFRLDMRTWVEAKAVVADAKGDLVSDVTAVEYVPGVCVDPEITLAADETATTYAKNYSLVKIEKTALINQVAVAAPAFMNPTEAEAFIEQYKAVGKIQYKLVDTYALDGVAITDMTDFADYDEAAMIPVSGDTATVIAKVVDPTGEFNESIEVTKTFTRDVETVDAPVIAIATDMSVNVDQTYKKVTITTTPVAGKKTVVYYNYNVTTIDGTVDQAFGPEVSRTIAAQSSAENVVTFTVRLENVGDTLKVSAKAYYIYDDDANDYYGRSAEATAETTHVWTIGDQLSIPGQDFVNDPVNPWTPATAPVTFDPSEGMRSPVIGNNESATLKTTVFGPGQFSIEYKTDCEDDVNSGKLEWDSIEIRVDGELKLKADGANDWTELAFAIEGEGAHEITFTYMKDQTEIHGEDAVWVRNMSWAPYPDLSMSEIEWNAAYTFNGLEQAPVKGDFKIFVVRTVDYVTTTNEIDEASYELEVVPVKNAGIHTLKIVADQKTCMGEKEFDWAIAKYDLTTAPAGTCTAEFVGAPFTYTGSEIVPAIASIKVVIDGVETTGTPARFTSDAAETAAGDYTATITAKPAAVNYTGSFTQAWSIAPKTLADNMISLSAEEFVFDRTEQKPTVTVVDGQPSVIDEDDYEVAFSDDCTNVGEKKVTLTAKRNYTGTVEKTYTIKPATIATVTIDPTEVVYSRTDKTVTVTQVTSDTVDLQASEYTVDGTVGMDAGTYTVTVTATDSNFTGSATANWTIKPIDMATAAVVVMPDPIELVYNDQPQKPTVADVTSVTFDTLAPTVFAVGTVAQKDVGEYIYKITSDDGNFTGSRTGLKWKIVPAAITDEMVTVTTPELWTGAAITPQVTVSMFDRALVKDTEYTVSIDDDTTAGEHTLTITGIGNFAGTITKTWSIKPTAPVITPHDAGAIVQEIQLYGHAKVQIAKADTEWSIYYTTDGSDPSAMNGTKYSRAFIANDKTTVRAVAVSKDGKMVSDITEVKYSQDVCAKPVIVLQDRLTSKLAVDGNGDATIDAATQKQTPLAFSFNDQVVVITRGNVDADGNEITSKSSYTDSNGNIHSTAVYTDGHIVYSLYDENDELIGTEETTYDPTDPAFEPIKISATTKVVAKVIGENFFDSEEVTVIFTRETESFEAPVITLLNHDGSDPLTELTTFDQDAWPVKIAPTAADLAKFADAPEYTIYYELSTNAGVTNTYTGNLTIDQTTTIKAWISDDAGNYGEGAVGTETFIRGQIDVEITQTEGGIATLSVDDERTFKTLLATVTVSSTAGNKAFVTTDGSDPTIEGTTAVDLPYSFQIGATNEAIVVKALAAYYKDGVLISTSEIKTVTYTYQPDEDLVAPTVTIEPTETITKVRVTVKAPEKTAKVYWNLTSDSTNEPIGITLVNGEKVPASSDYVLEPLAETSQAAENSVTMTVDIAVDETLYLKAVAYREIDTDDDGVADDWTAKSAMASTSKTRNWHLGDSMGVPDQEFSTDYTTTGFNRDDEKGCAASQTHNDAVAGSLDNISTMSTSVTGWGTVSFDWMPSFEGEGLADDYWYDRAEFVVDGEVVKVIDGDNAGWQTFKFDVNYGASDTAHTFQWRFVKDWTESAGDDTLYVKNFNWTPSTWKDVAMPMDLDRSLGDVKVADALESWFAASGHPDWTIADRTPGKVKEILQRKRSAQYDLGNGKDYSVWQAFVYGVDWWDPADNLVISAPVLNDNYDQVSITVNTPVVGRVYNLVAKVGLTDSVWMILKSVKVTNETTLNNDGSLTITAENLDHIYDTEDAQIGTPYQFFTVTVQLDLAD